MTVHVLLSDPEFTEPPHPPLGPPLRFVLSHFSSLCQCGSSIKKTLFREIGCIQPNCVNYWKGFPSEDFDDSSGVINSCP